MIDEDYKRRLERLSWDCKQLSRNASNISFSLEKLKEELESLVHSNNRISNSAESLFRRLSDEILGHGDEVKLEDKHD